MDIPEPETTWTATELAHLARALFLRGHNAPLDGNLSARIGDLVIITPTGVHKGELRPHDLVVVSLSGQTLRGTRSPSSELKLHLHIYTHRPDVRAIVHAHSPYAVALSLRGLVRLPRVVPEAVVALGDVPVLPYVRPTTNEVATQAADCALCHDVFVLGRHGTVALGKSLFEAYERLEVVEHVAKIYTLARSLGPVEELSDDEIDALRRG